MARSLKDMNLIVRVKRRRSQDPSDSLWIVDDAGVPNKKKSTARAITDSLRTLSTSTNDANPEKSSTQNRRMFLQRIQTVEVGAEAELDKSSLSASISKSQKRGRIEVEASNTTDKAETESTELESSNKDVNLRDNSEESSSMWITSGKKVLRSSYTLEKFVIVDVTKIPFTRPSSVTSKCLESEIGAAAANSSTKLNRNTPKKLAVIDPATRKLDAAIEKAFKLNDFNEMAQALQIGKSKKSSAFVHMILFMHCLR